MPGEQDDFLRDLSRVHAREMSGNTYESSMNGGTEVTDNYNDENDVLELQVRKDKPAPNKNHPIGSLATQSPQTSLQIQTKRKNLLAFSQRNDEETERRFDFVDILVALGNCYLLVFKPRLFNIVRFGNTASVHEQAGQEFRLGRFHKLHNGFTAKYKYHPLQRKKNLIRRFNVADVLADHMLKLGGTKYFYHAVCGHPLESDHPSYDPDLTTLDSLSTIAAAAKHLYTEMRKFNTDEQALVVKKSFERGFSRKIDVFNFDDWQAFRTELLSGRHLAKDFNNSYSDVDTVPIAVSYKAKEMSFTRRIFYLREVNGKLTENEAFTTKQQQQLTLDFVDDFRWGQLVRVCMQIAKSLKTNSVRLWIDRLITMEQTDEEKRNMYNLSNWWDFGVFPYAVFPVVRLYEGRELEFGTDFWRKIETVLGVAGRGLYVDDYLIRVQDKTIYYGPEIYSQIGSGIARLGGDGIYLRAVTLAMATAILTDGITVRGINEDLRTVREIPGFKAWALRTIGEGAYSSSHSALMRVEDPYQIGLQQFKTIVTWESFVSTCDWLKGKSYLDMSYQRSHEHRYGGHWDGVIEWVGMIKGAVDVVGRESIMSHLNNHVSVQTWVATTGHAASMLKFEVQDERPLGSKTKMLKRSLVVEIARLSNTRQGHISAVAEATGLWGESVLRKYFYFGDSPHRFQYVVPYEEGICDDYSLKPRSLEDNNADYEVIYQYAPIYFLVSSSVWKWIIICAPIFVVVVIVSSRISVPLILIFVILIAVLAALCVCYSLLKYYFCYYLAWPWSDWSGYGAAVFDNVLMHSLYNAGIKILDYRELKPVEYQHIEWN